MLNNRIKIAYLYNEVFLKLLECVNLLLVLGCVHLTIGALAYFSDDLEVASLEVLLDLLLLFALVECAIDSLWVKHVYIAHSR